MAGVDSFPRVELGHWPTRVEALDRLSDALGGARIFVKRDDCSGLAFGGNKVRKLEYLLGEALARGARRIITVGGVQSNHARQTAAASARVGLACDLVLPRLVADRAPGYEETGNVLLDRLLGARVHVVDGANAQSRIESIEREARARGETTAFFPSGGSTAIGSLGYARAAHEIVEQMDAAGRALDRIVLAVSTGGTHAGLLAGLRWLGRDTAVEGVAVARDAETTRGLVEALAKETAALLGAEPPAADAIAMRGDQLGPGYGLPTDAMREAVSLCARLEGLLLDPVYTGKAIAALIEGVRSGRYGADERILFLHTGGTPALFAYGDALAGVDGASTNR